MALLLDSEPGLISFWRDPTAWLREKNLSRGYWVFFSAAFFFDAGFSIYYFLFNLFLLDCHFNERSMGWIGGAMTFGSVIGTLPTGAIARRVGLRRLLIFLFVTAPLLNGLRTLWIWEPAQIGLAFAAGVAMSIWGVCFLPAIARLTTERNRTSAFSLIFCVSIVTGMLGGVVCGYLGSWLSRWGVAMRPVEVKRLILLVSCAMVVVGLLPVFRLRMPANGSSEDDRIEKQAPASTSLSRGLTRRSLSRRLAISPFLMRFLPMMAMWSAIIAAFSPFANVYLTRDLQIPIEHIGLIFSTVQVLQFFMGLASPFLFRVLGLLPGIAASQIATAMVLGLLAGAHNGKLAVVLYLIFSAAQWVSSPGLYNLLMTETPDRDRSTAAAQTLFCNALAGSAATAIAGILFTRFGYPPVLLGIAVAALCVGSLFLLQRANLQQQISTGHTNTA